MLRRRRPTRFQRFANTIHSSRGFSWSVPTVIAPAQEDWPGSSLHQLPACPEGRTGPRPLAAQTRRPCLNRLSADRRVLWCKRPLAETLSYVPDDAAKRCQDQK